MIGVVARPGIISFAGGLPASDLLPAEAFAECIYHVLTSDGSNALQYRPAHMPLIEAIIEIMAHRGVTVRAEQVLITTGAQQALSILAMLLVDPDSPVIHEQVVYTGIRQAFGWRTTDVRLVPTSLDRGIDVDAVASAISGSPPRAIVVVPNYHNPLGVTIPFDSRQRLIEIARAHETAIIEDDPYGLLYFDRPPPESMLVLDPEHVLFVSSFSKLIAPALRLGWIVAPPPLIEKLRVLKEGLDLETGGLVQRAAAEYVRRGYLWRHLGIIRAEYRQRRNTMMAAIAEHFPPSCQHSNPDGGMFVWVELPFSVDMRHLLDLALDQQVAFIPGAAFAPDGIGARALRLNFSNSPPALIMDGIQRLGRVLAQAAAEAGRPVAAGDGKKVPA